MADPGQPDKSPSGPPVPKWAPEPDDNDAPKHSAEAASSATPPSFGGDYAATMRLIPVPPPATPPPAFGVPAAHAAGDPTPPHVPGEGYIGKYRLKGELGRGGMGTVYLAEQPGLGREVAIKELIQSADPVALKRFLQEAQVMARTSHPNLVQVHDMELMGNINYLVLEFVRGRSLRDWMMASQLPPPQVFAVMHGVLQALDYAHRHAIVHRDMKPENGLISDEGMVKVADFGIARVADVTGRGPDVTWVAAQPRAGRGPVPDGARRDAGDAHPVDPYRHRNRSAGGCDAAFPRRLQPDAAGQARGQEVDELPERDRSARSGDRRAGGPGGEPDSLGLRRALVRRLRLAGEGFACIVADQDVARAGLSRGDDRLLRVLGGVGVVRLGGQLGRKLHPR